MPLREQQVEIVTESHARHIGDLGVVELEGLPIEYDPPLLSESVRLCGCGAGRAEVEDGLLEDELRG